MRILVVNWLDRENPQSGGAEAHLHQIFGRLAARGHQVTALVSGWPGAPTRTRLDGIEVHRAGRRYTFSLAAPRYHRRHLADEDFDVVVEDLNKVPLFTRFWTAAPTVLLVHHLFGSTAFEAGSWPVAAVTWLLERPIPLLYRGLPIVAVSESTREDLTARGLPEDRIRVITNGIDVDRYTPAGTNTVSPTLVFVGRLKAYKHVDLVVRAVAELAHRGLRVEVRVAGKGEQELPLRRLADRLGVSDQVHLLGFVSEEEKLQLLRTSWIHVLTSPKEGWGIASLEAAACGTPTVASDAPGLRESVVDGATGLLVPHGDVDRLASAVARLVQDPELRSRMGRDARRFAEGFSWDSSTDAFEEVLRRVVEDGEAD
ncbi:MAG: glycosyltransferase family 4 protein [Longimicrobiales bacterium]|nr:glycosyltransferase family 4 protein [Longimicrobiales bacterium]